MRADAPTVAGTIPLIRDADDLSAYLDAPPDWPREIGDEHLVAVLRFLHAVGYRNVRDKGDAHPWDPGVSDIVRLKTLNPIRYHMFTMPRLDAETAKLRRLKFGEVLSETYEMGKVGAAVLVQANMPRRLLLNGRRCNQDKADGAIHLRYTTHLVLESDSMSSDDQFRVRDALSRWLCAAVFSGGSSLHLWLELERRRISNGNPGVSYVAARARVWRWIREHGVGVCPASLNDVNHWFRIPCMPRGVYMTLRVATPGDARPFSSGEYPPDPGLSRRYDGQQDAAVKPHDASRGFRTSPDLFSSVPDGSEPQGAHEGVVSKVPPAAVRTSGEEDDEDITKDPPPEERGGSEGEEEPAPITTIHFPFPSPLRSPSRGRAPTFIDLMNRHHEAKTRGLPRPGARRQCHYVLLSIRRVMGWDDEDTVSEFEEILDRSSGRYRCTKEEAVEDFRRHLAASRNSGRVRMPDLTGQRLPDDAFDRVADHLGSEGRHAKRIAKLVVEFLWDKALVNPSMAWNGELGIKASDMIAVVGARYWNAVRGIMDERNLLVQTRDCIPNRRTRRYMVNLPLIIWVVWGDRPDELDWGRASDRAFDAGRLEGNWEAA